MYSADSLPTEDGVLAAAQKLAETILTGLQAHADPENAAGMARYGISSEGTLGVSIPVQRGLAAEAKRALKGDPREDDVRHAAAAILWASGIHEARITAGFVDVAALVSRAQMDEWSAAFDSWDVCDQVSTNLFDRTPLAWQAAEEYCARDETFVKRCGFVIVAGLAVHAKGAENDERLAQFLPLIEREASDERNFVKKAVNWALRQIGKRSLLLNAAAVETAERILAQQSGSPAARWVARDALRELTDETIRSRIKR